MIEDFKHSMRVMGSAVTIITVGQGDTVAGLTATAVCSLSMDPPRILVCLNRFGSTFGILSNSAKFCVNLISAEDRPMAERFAGRTGATGQEKFEAADWIFQQDHAPRLASALSAISCAVHSMTVLETHAIVIGSVEAVFNGPASAPLLYHNQQFGTFCSVA